MKQGLILHLYRVQLSHPILGLEFCKELFSLEMANNEICFGSASKHCHFSKKKKKKCAPENALMAKNLEY